MTEPSLDDLRLFLALAAQGSISATAKQLSMSAATLSRRINQLEKQTGRTLFIRQANGYALTADGVSLRQHVSQLDTVRADLADWLASPTSQVMVRLSAGTWTCQFLIAQIERLWQEHDAFGLLFMSTEERLSISHREIDIGLRNSRPDEPNLATRRLAEVCFASYASQNLVLAENDHEQWPWLVVAPDCARTRSANWMVEHRLAQSTLQVTASRTLLDLAIAGAGVTVLPCFIGDRLPALRRVGPVIDELTEAQWLVMHNETRHRPEVRTVIDRLGTLIDEHADLYNGKRPFEQ